jgi:hypothetical protein
VDSDVSVSEHSKHGAVDGVVLSTAVDDEAVLTAEEGPSHESNITKCFLFTHHQRQLFA